MSSYPEGPGPGPTTVRQMDFVSDKVIGIILIILNAIGACGGFAIMGLGTAFGGIMQQAADNAVSKGQATPEQAKAVATLFGMGAGLFGGLIVAACILGIINGFGIFKSARWGFIMGIALSAVHIILSISSVNFISIIIAVATIIYCAMRLTGNLGPKPMA